MIIPRKITALAFTGMFILATGLVCECHAQHELDIKALKKEADKKDSAPAAKQKVAVAYLLLGDQATAERYLLKAYEQGDSSAAFRLAMLYETKNRIPSDKKLGLATPGDAALFFYQQAAESIPLASLKAGIIFFNQGNWAKAAEYLKKPAENHIAEAYFPYGRSIMFGNLGSAQETAYYLHLAVMADDSKKDRALKDLEALRRKNDLEAINRGIELADKHLKTSNQ